MLRAGAAMVDIAPPAGTHLSGSGAGEYRPSESVLDPLLARAVVFDSGGKKLCILQLDICIITEDFTERIRSSAAERFGFDADAVMIHALQIHSAPSCGTFMLDPDFPLETTPETEYLTGSEFSYGRIAEAGGMGAIQKAVDSLEDVQIGAASGVKDRLAFNRRGVGADGKVFMPWFGADQPFGPVNLKYLEGPTDPELGVLCARAPDKRLVAALLHYTCHPVNVFATKPLYHAVSADWPGAWSAGMQKSCGDDCVPLVINGCCGNINPWDPFDPNFVPDHERMGAELTEMASRLLPTIEFTDADTLDWRVRRVPLPFREVPRERLEEVERILSRHPEPKWIDQDGKRRLDTEWFHAASTRSIEHCRNRTPEFPYEIQVLRIGDAAVVGLPGEPFVEGQLEIKIKSPAGTTYVAHCVSHYAGYLPTRDAYARGGHEANDKYTFWAKLAPGCLETVVERTVEMLNELFPT